MSSKSNQGYSVSKGFKFFNRPNYVEVIVNPSQQDREQKREDKTCPTCHWCDKKVPEPSYYFTKMVNNYGLPVSFCLSCVPLLIEWDPKAMRDLS
jgi:hypothetical protein